MNRPLSTHFSSSLSSIGVHMEDLLIWSKYACHVEFSENIYDKKRIEYEQLNVNTHEHQIRKVDDYISFLSTFFLGMKETKCSCPTSKKIISTAHQLLLKSCRRSFKRVLLFILFSDGLSIPTAFSSSSLHLSCSVQLFVKWQTGRQYDCGTGRSG